MTLSTARLLTIAAAALFSTGGAGIKVAAFTGPQVASARSGIAALALLLWLRGGVHLSWAALGLGLIYACMIALFVNATKLTTAANAIFLQSAAPLYVLLLAPRLLGERFHRRHLAYLSAAAVGMALCMSGQQTASALAPDPARGNALGILSGLTWALLLVGIRMSERDRPGAGIAISAVVIGNGVACLASLPFAWPLPEASAYDWATLAYLGVCQLGLAYFCLTRAMRLLPALDASLLLLLEPVLNPIWTWLVRGERPGRGVLLGGAVIIAATALKTMHDARWAAARVEGPAGETRRARDSWQEAALEQTEGNPERQIRHEHDA
jgi:drug/metabolite transporter (DMT)-like permease